MGPQSVSRSVALARQLDRKWGLSSARRLVAAMVQQTERPMAAVGLAVGVVDGREVMCLP